VELASAMKKRYVFYASVTFILLWLVFTSQMRRCDDSMHNNMHASEYVHSTHAHNTETHHCEQHCLGKLAEERMLAIHTAAERLPSAGQQEERDRDLLREFDSAAVGLPEHGFPPHDAPDPSFGAVRHNIYESRNDKPESLNTTNEEEEGPKSSSTPCDVSYHHVHL
jgi:hypothetical protein